MWDVLILRIAFCFILLPTFDQNKNRTFAASGVNTNKTSR